MSEGGAHLVEFFAAPTAMNGRFGLRTISALGVRREKAMLFQWVKGSPGEVLPPEATGAVVEVTKPLKPSGICMPQNTVAARVCRP